MFRYELVHQGPKTQDAVLNAASDLAAVADFTRVRGSFAYANQTGAQQLTEKLRDALAQWAKVRMRWLISIDFGFTDPRALDLLASLQRSEVRIPNADYLLAHRLAPRVPFHPKSLILDAGQSAGSPPVAVLVGSANLTVSGMRRSHEHVTVAAWTAGNSSTLRQIMKAAHQEARRFSETWDDAIPLDAALLDRYTKAQGRVRRSRPWRDEDDTPEVRKLGETVATRSLDKAAELTRAKHLWVEAGKIVENLGKGNPGSQIDLVRGTRVFFGFPNRDVPRNSPLGSVFVRYGGSGPIDRHMRFGNNWMDKLDLPHPGSPGPAKYDHETLRFTRRDDGTFHLELGSSAQIREWKKKSRTRGTLYEMRRGAAQRAREYGVF